MVRFNFFCLIHGNLQQWRKRGFTYLPIRNLFYCQCRTNDFFFRSLALFSSWVQRNFSLFSIFSASLFHHLLRLLLFFPVFVAYTTFTVLFPFIWIRCLNHLNRYCSISCTMLLLPYTFCCLLIYFSDIVLIMNIQPGVLMMIF